MTIQSDTPNGTGDNGESGFTVGGAANAFEALFDTEAAPPRRQPNVRPQASDTGSDEHGDDPDPLDTGDAAAADALFDDETQDDNGDFEDHDDVPAELSKIRLRIKNGEQSELVPLPELLKGYQRQADYTRKTMDLAQQRQVAEQAFNGISQQRQQADQFLEAAGMMLQAQLPQGDIDWQTLASTDPTRYVQAKAAWDDAQLKLQQLAQLRQANQAKGQQEQQSVWQKHVQREAQALMDEMPQLRDPAKALALKTRIVDYAMSMGYSPQELGGLTDRRQIKILAEAAKYRALMKQTSDAKAGSLQQPPTNRSPGVRTAAPGVAPTATRNQNAAAKDLTRLRKSGKLGDAADAFEHFL